jgi:hypothetical protein
MPADDVDLTLMIREGQNSVGQNDSVVRALEIILMRSEGADPPCWRGARTASSQVAPQLAAIDALGRHGQFVQSTTPDCLYLLSIVQDGPSLL